MTDDRPPIDDSDEELVSAYLDGEATAAERVRVEADPRLIALVDSYRSAAAAVGSPVMPLDQPRRDAMVAAALAVLDDVDDEPGRPDAGSPPAKVVPLSGRRRWISRAPGLAAAAAILFLVGMGLVLSSRDSDRDQSAELSASTEQSTAAEDGDTAEAAAGDEPEADAEADALASPLPPVSSLGDFADDASLRAALASEPASSAQDSEEAPGSMTEEPRRASPPAAEVERCATVVTTTDPLLGDLIAVRTATLAGEPVLIYSHTERDEPDRIIDTVADRGSCQIRFAQAR
jgi:negative regulator of sigma E activity